DGAFRLLFEAVVEGGVVAGGLVEGGVESVEKPVAAPEPAPMEMSTGLVEEMPEVVETFGGRWDPDGPELLENRLAFIVAESMGYAPEDLPAEIPLIELGLDSLMAVRIKNRVEYEFDIPQLQLQAVRDANLVEVGKYVRWAVENREEVQKIADQQESERAAAEAEAAGAEEGSLDAETTSVEAEAEAILAETTADHLADTEGSTEVPPSAVGDENTTVEAAAEQILAEAASEQILAAANTMEAAAPSVTDQQSLTEAAGSDVPPRDAAERLTFATWAVVTGESAKGIFNTLPILEEEVAEKLAQRLSERADGEITVDDVLDAETIEQLADTVRKHLEGGSALQGVVRTLRARPEGSTATPVFVFHPAGGSTVVYEPLLKRLPADTPMYGFERVEGSIEERAREYLAPLRAIAPEGPYVLYGWSLGGVLAFAVANLLREQGADVRYVGLIDVAMPADPPDESPAGVRARWERYAEFAKRTYGVDAPLPYDRLAEADEEEQIQIIMDLVKLSGAKIPGGVIEHQRTSWIDTRELLNASSRPYDGDVVLYLADRYHADAIMLEPRFGKRAPNGAGWGDDVSNLEVIHVGGDHLQIIDEPYIAKVGADLTKRLEQLKEGSR
ncbi:MAG TPA: thioesterase domain-containing protein, partial [Aldersonia sp.]